MALVNPRIEIARGLDGEAVVLALFDIGDEDLQAAAHAVRAAKADRFRTAVLSTDDVLEMRELTALTDQLDDMALVTGVRAVVLKPARLAALRHGLEHYVDALESAEWMRDSDREPLARVRAMLWPLEDLGAEAIRAALAPEARRDA
jgi:hypothetical protein